MSEMDDAGFLKKLAADYAGHKVILENLGKAALERALTNHFTTELQNDPNLLEITIPELVDLHLSRYNLKFTFKNLYKNGLIEVRKFDKVDHTVTGPGVLVMRSHAMIMGISSFKEVGPQMWEHAFKKVLGEGKLYISAPCQLVVLEKEEGFDIGMHRFALQVAGLMYIAAIRDDATFWNNYKDHMKLSPVSEFRAQEKESRQFEWERRYVLEAIPYYMGCVTILEREGKEKGKEKEKGKGKGKRERERESAILTE